MQAGSRREKSAFLHETFQISEQKCPKKYVSKAAKERKIVQNESETAEKKKRKTEKQASKNEENEEKSCKAS